MRIVFVWYLRTSGRLCLPLGLISLFGLLIFPHLILFALAFFWIIWSFCCFQLVDLDRWSRKTAVCFIAAWVSVVVLTGAFVLVESLFHLLSPQQFANDTFHDIVAYLLFFIYIPFSVLLVAAVVTRKRV